MPKCVFSFLLFPLVASHLPCLFVLDETALLSYLFFSPTSFVFFSRYFSSFNLRPLFQGGKWTKLLYSPPLSLISPPPAQNALPTPLFLSQTDESRLRCKRTWEGKESKEGERDVPDSKKAKIRTIRRILV